MHHQPRTNNCTEPPSLVARTIVLSCLTLLALAASGVGISGTAGLERGLALVFGLIVLAIVAVWDSMENLETGAAFWHMVDLVWVLIFPVIYLVR